MNGKIGAFVTLVIGLLLLAVGSQYLSRVDDAASPSANSVRPSGAAVFARLLQSEGYRVRIDRSLAPKVAPGEVAIVFRRSDSDFDAFQQTEDQLSTRALIAVRNAVSKGAGAIYLPLISSYEDAVKRAEAAPTKVTRLTDRAVRTLYVDPNGTPVVESAYQPLYSNGRGDFVSVSQRGKGFIVGFGDGTLATNRLIDNGDNARVLLEAVQIAGEGKKVVFTEATFDAQTPGLLEMLGPWAQGFFYQTLFLFVLAIATLGRRFGLEDIAIRAVRSSRDLADGISDTMRRGRMAGTALGLLLEDRERRTGIKPDTHALQSLGDPDLPEDQALQAARRNL